MKDIIKKSQRAKYEALHRLAVICGDMYLSNQQAKDYADLYWVFNPETEDRDDMCPCGDLPLAICGATICTIENTNNQIYTL